MNTPDAGFVILGRMKSLRYRVIWGTVLSVTIAAAGVLGFRVLFASRKPTAPACPMSQGLAFGCYEAYYSSIVGREGVGEAFVDLKARYPTDPRVQALCHAITHHIGQAAFRKYADISAAFLHGDNVCGSGYYHGVLEGLASRMGREKLLSNLDSICAGMPGKERYSLDYYNCVHGLGHGIMAITGDELFDALHHCDKLTGSVEQTTCDNGVFMENLIVDGEHGGNFSRYLKPAEPLYPCTVVERKYKPACLEIQTSYALGAVRGDVAKVFALCADLEMSFRSTCYQSIGRDAATISLNRVPGTVATCNLGIDYEQRSNCITGAVLDFVYYYHGSAQALELCAALDQDLRRVCRSTVAKVVGRF